MIDRYHPLASIPVPIGEYEDLKAEIERLNKTIEDAPCNCPCCTGACTQEYVEPFRQRTAADG